MGSYDIFCKWRSWLSVASSIFLKIYDNDKEKKMAVFTGAGVALGPPWMEVGGVNFEK